MPPFLPPHEQTVVHIQKHFKKHAMKRSYSPPSPPIVFKRHPACSVGSQSKACFSTCQVEGSSLLIILSVFLYLFLRETGSMCRDRQLASLKRCALQIRRVVALVINLQYDTVFGGAGCWSRDPDSKEEEWWSFPPFLRPPVMKGSLTQIKRKDSNACASVAGASKCLKKHAGQQNFDLQFSLIYLFD